MFLETIGDSHTGRKVAKRHLLALFTVLAFGLTMYPSKAQAQIVGDLEVNIPFQFHAGNAKLPAGDYRIHVMEDSNLTIMEISSADGSTSTLFQVHDTDANSTPTKNELIFNKYGNRYFLAKLFQEGSSSGSQVLESRYEERISHDETMEGQEHVAARRAGQRAGQKGN